MSEQQQAQSLKHFQLALSMVGISANLMTCELIKAISTRCDEMGEAFNIGEANKIANGISEKYNAGKPKMPEGMMTPANLPKSIQDMVESGHIMMGSKTEKPIEPIPPVGE